MIAEIAVMTVLRELFFVSYISLLLFVLVIVVVVAGMAVVRTLATHVRNQVPKSILHSHLDFYKINIPTVII